MAAVGGDDVDAGRDGVDGEGDGLADRARVDQTPAEVLAEALLEHVDLGVDLVGDAGEHAAVELRLGLQLLAERDAALKGALAHALGCRLVEVGHELLEVRLKRARRSRLRDRNVRRRVVHLDADGPHPDRSRSGSMRAQRGQLVGGSR